MRLSLIDVHDLPRRNASFQSLTLPRVAGCTPSHVRVSITDGRVERIDLRAERADLVGMTFGCNMSPRAYQLADELRSRGVAVIAGGTHATAVPDEALQHFDAVLSGEAEGGAWAHLLSDYEAGRMGGVYKNDQAPSLAGLAPPRLDLLRHPGRYIDFTPIEATRGCTHDCDFCFNSTIHGPRFRTRPVEEVVEDARRATSRNLMFMDDNLTGRPAYAKALFEALIPLRKRLFFQTHLLMAEDAELMSLAQRAGTQFVFVGVESFEEASLASVNKGWNKIDRYKRYLHTFHAHDIFVSAGMILGLDCDGPDIFDKTLGYLEEIGADNAALNLMIPYPGTESYDRIVAEGRLLTMDRSRYTGFDVVVKPKKLTVQQLEEGYRRVLRRFYGPRRFARTMASNGMWRRSPVYAVAWWREPRRFSYRSLGRHLKRRGGEVPR